MARSRPQVLKATALRDIVAAVPFQCGFHPRHSVVVLSLRGPRRRVGQVTRADLPRPEDVAEAARELAGFVVRDRGSAAMVLVYDDEPWDADRPPRLDLVSAVLDELHARGVSGADAVYVTQQRYWSYLCRGRGCCPAEGAPVADARSSPVAAAYVLAGLAPLPDRDAVVARVQPIDPEVVTAVTESAWGWLSAFAAAADDAAADPAVSLRDRTGAAFAALEHALAPYLDGAGGISVDRAGELAALVQDPAVRDDVLMSLCRGPRLPGTTPGLAPVQTPVPAPEETDPLREQAVERLLVDLSVRLVGPLACAPLSMLAWHSWARGEGALARVAVDRARQEDPTYRLALLLSTILDHAVAPDWVEEMRHEDDRAG